MNLRVLIGAVVVAAIGLLYWRWPQPPSVPAAPESRIGATMEAPPPPPPTSVSTSPGESPVAPAAAKNIPLAPPTTPATPGTPVAANPPPMPPIMPDGAPPVPPPSQTEINPEQIATDLDNLALSLRDYRTIMVQNPVGTNAEITEALLGKNRKNARLAPEDARVNARGELVDRWGTAYFFHQISATSMEVHSAGPDQRMGTDDDIVQR